jgi:GNAT superfamily N-acetyltransferase
VAVSDPVPVAHATAVVEIGPLPYTDPVAQELVEQLQQEYVRRYGGRDQTPVDPAQFTPPDGVLLVALLAGDPVGCGGWRWLDRPGTVEIKRMYVAPAARGRGVARAVLAELERTAAAAGATEILLETGTEQPEAIALYGSSGYRPVPGFGHYAGRPKNRSFGKRLPPVPPGAGHAIR